MFRKAFLLCQLFPIVFYVSHRKKKLLSHCTFVMVFWNLRTQLAATAFGIRVLFLPTVTCINKGTRFGWFCLRLHQKKWTCEFTHGCTQNTSCVQTNVILKMYTGVPKFRIGFWLWHWPLVVSLLVLKEEKDRMFLYCCWILA